MGVRKDKKTCSEKCRKRKQRADGQRKAYEDMRDEVLANSKE